MNVFLRKGMTCIAFLNLMKASYLLMLLIILLNKLRKIFFIFTVIFLFTFHNSKDLSLLLEVNNIYDNLYAKPKYQVKFV